jgi:hypothetical protein
LAVAIASPGKVRENVNGADDHQRLLARLLNVFFLAVDESSYALADGQGLLLIQKMVCMGD